MKQDELIYRNADRDIWCVKDSDGKIISTSEVPKGSVTPEEILTHLAEEYSTKNLEIYHISAEEIDEHEKKVFETGGRIILEGEVILRIPEIISEKKDGVIAIIEKPKEINEL